LQLCLGRLRNTRYVRSHAAVRLWVSRIRISSSYVRPLPSLRFRTVAHGGAARIAAEGPAPPAANDAAPCAADASFPGRGSSCMLQRCRSRTLFTRLHHVAPTLTLALSLCISISLSRVCLCMCAIAPYGRRAIDLRQHRPRVTTRQISKNHDSSSKTSSSSSSSSSVLHLVHSRRKRQHRRRAQSLMHGGNHQRNGWQGHPVVWAPRELPTSTRRLCPRPSLMRRRRTLTTSTCHRQATRLSNPMVEVQTTTSRTSMLVSTNLHLLLHRAPTHDWWTLKTRHRLFLLKF
jgi:hypothetical protein